MAETDGTYGRPDQQNGARMGEHQDGWTREQGRFLFSASREREPVVTRFAHRCTGERGAATERWLQSVLEKEAAILRDVIAPVSRDHREDEPWYCLGREKGVPNIGAIDVLYVTGSGRPIIVETKLIRNPESRREVVAQVAEYAMGLRSLKAEDLIDPANADEELMELTPDMQRNLGAGRLDLVIVGDEIDDRAVSLGHHLINHDPTSQMCIWFVEIGLFEAQGHPASRIIVPTLRHASLAEVRHTIEVSAHVIGAEVADLQVATKTASARPSGQPSTRGSNLSESVLIQQIEVAKGPKIAAMAKRLLDHAHKLGLHIGMRPRAASIRLEAPGEPSKKMTLLVVTHIGTFYAGWLERWEEYIGASPEVARRYHDRLEKLLGRSPVTGSTRPEAGIPLERIGDHLNEVLDAIDEAVRALRGERGIP